MSIFADIFSQIGAPSLVDTHGESVTYAPKAGQSYSISAVVYRKGALQSSAHIFAANPVLDIAIGCSLNQIASLTVNADKVTLYRNRHDSQTRTYTITEIISQDGDFVILGLK